MDSLIISLQDLDLSFDIYELPSIDEMISVVESYTGIAIKSHRIIYEPSSTLNASDTLFSKKISIRIPHNTLDDIKQKASDMGLPYQTLINFILNEYAAGKVNL